MLDEGRVHDGHLVVAGCRVLTVAVDRPTVFGSLIVAELTIGDQRAVRRSQRRRRCARPVVAVDEDRPALGM